MKKAMLGLALVLLAGCAATTEDLAKSGDYDRGYLEGVAEYCNPDFAYQMGLSGQYYEGVCEGTEQAQKFRMEWQRGWNEYSN
ncbi:hypothetical protein BBL97_11120 [Vibrio parahaemolyticus]|uniref:DUF2799 domain-containing protein n=1 Tax=Vibrio parahaemolyticus TaxID=670 RepID=UPI00084ADB3D|nr:DUF2799 domain-containing protein [Vibrio parahaemolyticus]ODW89529.1 hypothetical protein BBL95_23290 [Vibrio parahaemolyticus]ODX07972.1 hypothetical protein BBL98_11715 [Vibrio parahaemolyticus]ODX08024.1 hypothetical protein BBL97_11120 [Vibrio parahaemolyticus]ODX09101.1 hypothetical protein BBL96_10300 [Vibrio parahaemolyticus]ODX23910.1 hypothetical protein BBL99_04375 [Vibrio parahaemolyticus]